MYLNLISESQVLRELVTRLTERVGDLERRTPVSFSIQGRTSPGEINRVNSSTGFAVQSLSSPIKIVGGELQMLCSTVAMLEKRIGVLERQKQTSTERPEKRVDDLEPQSHVSPMRFQADQLPPPVTRNTSAQPLPSAQLSIGQPPVQASSGNVPILHIKRRTPERNRFLASSRLF